MRLTKNKFSSLVWLASGAFLYLIGRDFYKLIPEFQLSNILHSIRIQIFVAYILISGYFWLSAWGKIREGGWPKLLLELKYRNAVIKLNKNLRWVIVIILAFTPAIIFYYSPLAYEDLGAWIKLSAILFFALLIEPMISNVFPNYDTAYKRFYIIMAISFIVVVGGVFSQVTSYPFSLSWSEGNRLYDYSVRFGSDRYQIEGDNGIIALISRGKSVVYGLPFIFPQANIFIVRLWIAMLNIIPATILGFLLIVGKNNEKINWGDRTIFLFWVTLFLFQGPIQANLLIAAILTILGVRSKRLFVGLCIVVLAGYFSYISRWSWGYAPGLWAGMLSLLHVDGLSFNYSEWKKTIRPILFGLAGFVGENITRNPFDYLPEDNTSLFDAKIVIPKYSISQDLLWERLLPNSTFAPGIILGLLFAVGPIIVWLYFAYHNGSKRLNLLQTGGTITSLVIFSSIGIIASIKIGGGGDLHNADMFFIGIAMITGYFWVDLLNLLRTSSKVIYLKSAAYLLLMVPILYFVSMQNFQTPNIPDDSIVSSSLQTIQTKIYKANEVGEILFMDARQLLTFGYIKGIPLISEYEKKLIIDNAFSENLDYFSKFYNDLEEHKFAMIVSDPLNLRTGNKNSTFSNENDIWVEWVSKHILSNYKILFTFEEVGIQLLIPR